MYLLKEYFTTFCLVLTVFILFLTTLFKSKSKHLEKGIKSELYYIFIYKR